MVCRRQYNDGNAWPVFGEMLQTTKAINFGHVKVDDDNFSLVGNDFECLAAVGGREHLKSGLLRLISEKASDGVVVIRDNQLGFSRGHFFKSNGLREQANDISDRTIVFND